MPFTAGGSATSGLTAYSLERPAHTLYPEAAGYRRPGSLWAARFTRLLGRKGVGGPQETPARKALDMSTPLQELVDALKKSASEIIMVAVPEKRDELLGKAIDNFASDLLVITDEAVEEAFSDGLSGNMGKYFGANRATMRKGLTHVSQFAMTLRSAESLVKGMSQDAWDNPPSEEAIDGLSAWVGIGKGLLKRITDEAVSGDDADEVTKAYGLDGAELKKYADGIGELIERHQYRLAKAEGDGVSDMDPLDVIARLATAILMQVDAIQDGTSGEGQGAADPAAEPGAQPGQGGQGQGQGGGGQVPPQFRKGDMDGELSKVLVEPEVVDSATLVYRVTGDDSPAEVADIYDLVGQEEPRPLGKFADFATPELLAAASIPAGNYATCMAKGLFRVGTSPEGQLIAGVENVALFEEEPMGKADFGDTDDLRKFVAEAVGEAVAPLQQKVEELSAENQRLRKSAAPAKVALGSGRAVDKTDDQNLTKGDGELPTLEELAKMPEAERGVALMKYTQRRPIRAA